MNTLKALTNDEILKSLIKGKFFKLDLNSFSDKRDNLQLIVLIFLLSGCSAFDINFDPKNLTRIKKYIYLAVADPKKNGFLEVKPPIIFCSLTKQILDQPYEDLKNIFNLKILDIVKVVELDIGEYNLEEALTILEKIKNLKINKIISLSISRKRLSNASIIELIKYTRNFTKELMVEVDGLSSTNIKNEFNETLQVLSTVDIIRKQLISKHVKYRRLPIIIKGGINNSTRDLAIECDVKYNGISYEKYPKDLLPLKDFNKSDLDLYIQKTMDFISNSSL